MKRSTHLLKISPTVDNSILSNMLANEMALYINTRKLQWNILDEGFPYLHKLFQSLYAEIEETIDLLSNRINQLGGKATNAIQEGAELSRHNLLYSKHAQKNTITELLKEHEGMIVEINDEIEISSNIHESPGSVDFLKDVMAQQRTTNSTLRNIGKTISEVSGGQPFQKN